MRIKLLFGILFLTLSAHLWSQASPSGVEHGLPLTVGLGFANFDTDWSGRISGPTLTVNWNSTPIRGLGFEVEARDLRYGAVIKNFRFDTATGGAVYTVRRNKRLQPFGEFLAGLGSIDFHLKNSKYSHDTRTILVPGGGAKYLVLPNVWARVSYEYQIWPNMFHNHSLTPNGFTIGAAYDFGPVRRRSY